MTNVKIQAEIKIYKIDDKNTAIVDGPKLRVFSRWNDNNFVEIEFEGKRLTVVAKELITAIDRCS